MKARELCEKAWQEIASHFPDFTVTKKGQNLKKISKNKDLTFEIHFQASRHNYSCSAEFSVHFSIYSKSMIKANINNGFIYGGELESLIDRGRIFRWFPLTGASYQHSVNEIIELLEKYILPICENFEDTKVNIQNILNGDTKNIDLFYYIYFFDGKDSAEQYLNKFINQSNLKKKFKGLYHSLENVAKESIDINVSEFSGASTIKFAYLNGIKIEG